MSSTLALLGILAITSPQSSSLPTLYTGSRDTTSQGITLRGWGSGTINQTDETAFEGVNSIRISSRNFFQGGTVTFATPIDLKSAFANKANLLSVAIRAPQTTGGTTNAGSTSGAATLGGGGRGGEDRGGGAGDMTGGNPSSSGTTPAAEAFDTIRMILSTTDGKKSEIYVPTRTSRANDRGWIQIGVPLQAIRGLEKTNQVVQSISFSSNATATFFVGDVRAINDATPIYGEPSLRDANIGSGTELTFSANGFGGASILKYTWDFDSSNGIDVDAEGQTVKRRFRKPGIFTVTMTIADSFGLKAPYTTTIKVTVN